MKKIFLPVLISLLIFSNCQKGSHSDPNIDCAAVNCLSADPFFFLWFYDKTTNADLIATNVIDVSKLKAWNQDNEEVINKAGSFASIDSMKNSVVYTDLRKANLQSNRIYVKIDGRSPIEIRYDYKYTASGCCGKGLVENISLNGYSFSVHPYGNTPGNYKIIKIRL